MIDIRKGKVKTIMSDFHKAVEERWTSDDDADNLLMSRIIEELVADPTMEPRDCADILNDKYRYRLTGNDVIRLYKGHYLGNPRERASVIDWGKKVESFFEGAMYGDKKSFDKFNEYRKTNVMKSLEGRKNPQNYVLLNMIFMDFPEIDINVDAQKIKNLPVLPCKYLFFDLIDIIAENYGFESLKRRPHKQDVEEKLSGEQLKRKIDFLENKLDRTLLMMKELEDNFTDQLADTKAQELTQFFANLNSEKYGCILDELLFLRKGVNELRHSNYEVPPELSGVFIMITKLIQFIRDSHINPMMKMDSTISVKASDIESCNYEGTPFASKDDVKQIKVISPGWIYSDKEIQISTPHVKEVSNE